MKKTLFLCSLVCLFVKCTKESPKSTESADVTAPVISLTGDATLIVEQHSEFNDPGATATDDVDGDLSASIEVSGTVDTATLGDHTLTYQVADAAGNAASPVTRTVTVVQSETDNPFFGRWYFISEVVDGETLTMTACQKKGYLDISSSKIVVYSYEDDGCENSEDACPLVVSASYSYTVFEDMVTLIEQSAYDHCANKDDSTPGFTMTLTFGISGDGNTLTLTGTDEEGETYSFILGK